MSAISDFKSSPFALFGVNGGQTSTDTSLATLVGVKFQSADSRVFTLVQNAGTALASGVLVQGPATIGANHIGLTTATAATGATSITVTAGGTLITANQYAGGLATLSAGLGIGETLKISSHPAATSSGTCVLTLEDPISVNIDATTKTDLNLNPYGSANGTDVRTSGVIIAPSGTATGQEIGVSFYPIAASSATVPTFGFIQTKGPVACLAAGTGTAGLGIMLGAVNGAVSTFVAATQAQIGRFLATAEDAKAHLIYIDL